MKSVRATALGPVSSTESWKPSPPLPLTPPPPMDDTSKAHSCRAVSGWSSCSSKPQFQPRPLRASGFDLPEARGGHLMTRPVEDVKRFEPNSWTICAAEEKFLEGFAPARSSPKGKRREAGRDHQPLQEGFAATVVDVGGTTKSKGHGRREVAKESGRVKKDKPRKKESKDAKKDKK